MTKIIIQVFSDIHIELWNKIPDLPINSKNLILAGDICQLNHKLFYPFLDYCSSKWEKVFYIPGNHEYYSSKRNMDQLEFEYKYFIEKKYKNIFYLNNSYIPLDNDINIYGTTFWTEPPFESTYDAQMYINDYNYIKYFNQEKNKITKLDITKIKSLSDESFKKLQDYLNTEIKKTIIITHFPPTRTETINPTKFIQNSKINLYNAWPDTTLDKFNLNNVLVWISGHTHWSYDFVKNNIRLISNQIGYKSEIENIRINESGLYEIIVS